MSRDCLNAQRTELKIHPSSPQLAIKLVFEVLQVRLGKDRAPTYKDVDTTQAFAAPGIGSEHGLKRTGQAFRQDHCAEAETLGPQTSWLKKQPQYKPGRSRPLLPFMTGTTFKHFLATASCGSCRTLGSLYP